VCGKSVSREAASLQGAEDVTNERRWRVFREQLLGLRITHPKTARAFEERWADDFFEKFKIDNIASLTKDEAASFTLEPLDAMFEELDGLVAAPQDDTVLRERVLEGIERLRELAR